jgi:hypothetical protein
VQMSYNPSSTPNTFIVTSMALGKWLPLLEEKFCRRYPGLGTAFIHVAYAASVAKSGIQLCAKRIKYGVLQVRKLGIKQGSHGTAGRQEFTKSQGVAI